MANERDPLVIGRQAGSQPRPGTQPANTRWTGGGWVPTTPVTPVTTAQYNSSIADSAARNMNNQQTDTGMSAMDMYMDALNASTNTGGGGGGGGGGGRGGGGGGGGPAAPTPAVRNAYLSMWHNAIQPGADPWAPVDAANRAAYDPNAVNKRWDQTGQAVQGATQAGNNRMGGILGELLSRAAQGRTAVSQAVQQGATNLTGLQNQFQGQAAQSTQGLNQGLGAFGAGGVQDNAQDSLRNLFAAGQVNNQMLGNSYEAMAADRPGVYSALNADIRQGMTRDQAALENAIAVQRSNELRSNSLALAQALGQTGMARAQQEQERAQARDALRLEMAQLGIQVA